MPYIGLVQGVEIGGVIGIGWWRPKERGIEPGRPINADKGDAVFIARWRLVS